MTKTEAEVFGALVLKMTCGARPEQYDVILDGEPAGYLRLRHGHFTVSYPDPSGQDVYEAEPEGDGMFEPGEREFYLTQAKLALAKRIVG